MAGIDKIYGTQAQYLEFKAWLEGENAQQALYYLYPEEDYNEEYRPISNFPKEIDMQLLDCCPLEWVTDYIKSQYNIKL